MENKIEKFPVYLGYKNERTYCILGYIGEVDEYKDNKGYIDKEKGRVYICSKDKEPLHKDVPILKIEDGKLTEKDPFSSVILNAFDVKNIYKLDLDTIENLTTENEELYDEEALADMNAATSIFIPIINDYDDPLKKMIKKAIILKGIDINRLKHRLPNKYGVGNNKQALVNKTKMSISKFNVWCELLGIEYEIILKDNGSDNQDPLDGVLHFYSNNNRLVNIVDGEIVDDEEETEE